MIVIVGAGPAGMAAALRARESGAQVTVVDDNPAPGGQTWRGDAKNRYVARFVASGIPVLMGTRVVSGDAQTRTLVLETFEASRTLRYEKLVLAAGSRELFLPFPGWTLPGVFGAGGLQALAKAGLPVAGKKIVVGGTGPLLLAVAAYLRGRGARVILIAEQAPAIALAGFARAVLHSPRKIMQGARLVWDLAGVPYFTNCVIRSAEGRGRLQSVTVNQGRDAWTEECDYAAIGFGLVPNGELSEFMGPSPHVFLAGTGDVELSLVEGEIAGFAAAGDVARAGALYPRRDKARRFAAGLRQAFALRTELKELARPDTILCRCEDVTVGAVSAYPNARAAKLQTRCGMGPCQGRICGPAAEFLFGWNAGSARLPLFPARVGSLLPDKTEEIR